MINQNDARYVYLRDEENGVCWNIGKGPMNTEVDEYNCVHNIGYSKLQSKAQDIKAA